MQKSERFGLVLSPEEKAALQSMANRERLPAAAVVRRLIWEAMKANTSAGMEQRAEGTYCGPVGPLKTQLA